ncbi:MAG: hypothetical protein ACOC5T_05220 [Elusimicrobiota bacterium]
MGVIRDWREKRKKRREWVKEKVDQAMDQSDEVRKQKIKSRENVAKTIAKNMGNRQQIICPYLRQPSSGDIIELVREPTDPTDQPFGLSKGTIRATIAIFVTMGFLLITMMMVFLLPLSMDMIFQMWYVIAGVFAIVVASYFWTRISMGRGGFFPPFGGLGGY